MLFETERLYVREFTRDDADFILELLNDPGWLHYIGDRGVRTRADAMDYIENRLCAAYKRLGFGFYLAALKTGDAPLGMCGLIKRDTLPDVDIGFAFLPRYRAQGYALEAAQATVEYARKVLKLPRLAAITTPDNAPSQNLLAKLGMHWVERGTFGGDEELDYFVMDFADSEIK